MIFVSSIKTRLYHIKISGIISFIEPENSIYTEICKLKHTSHVASCKIRYIDNVANVSCFRSRTLEISDELTILIFPVSVDN